MNCAEWETIGRAMVEGFIEGLARGEREAACIADMIRKQEARSAALHTFRRAMKRYEKRARRMGMPETARALRWHRSQVGLGRAEQVESLIRGMISILRGADGPRWDRVRARRGAFLRECAADAVARLRAALAEAT